MRTNSLFLNICIVIGEMVAWAWSALTRQRTAVSPRDIYVIDGDTIDVHGRRYRLHGFDAPEISSPGCVHELQFGLEAKHRLQDLVATASTTSLTERETDGYGRTVATLFADGIDVAKPMIAAGAHPYYGHMLRENWCDCDQ